MNELIKIEEKNGQQLVNARDLYNFLDISKDFTNWIKAQIERARLVENRDYLIIPGSLEPGLAREVETVKNDYGQGATMASEKAKY